MYFHVQCMACRWVEFISYVDKQTGKKIKGQPEYLKNGQSALVKMRPISHNLVIEEYDKFKSLGRFMVKEDNKIIAVGIIKQNVLVAPKIKK